jgi:tetratricopeptide (TPR) repeat protein
LSATLEQALGHHQAGRLGEAEAVYREILKAEPENADALHMLGVVVFQAGRGDEAVGFIEHSLGLNPGNADALNNLGQVYEFQDRKDDAVDAYRKAVSAVPGFAPALVNLGQALLETDEAEEAAGCFEGARATFADDPDVLGGLGRALAAIGRTDEALTHLRRAREITPNDPVVLCNLGTALQANGDVAEAEAAFEAAISLEPGLAEGHYNLGLAYQEQGRLDDAVSQYGRALEIEPSHIMAQVNLSMAFLDLGRIDDAVATCRRALEEAPEHAEAHHNLSLALLLQGNFSEGWAEYEWRFKTGEGTQRQFPQVPWNGEPVDAKTVLVWAEQGVGDEVMFAGMVPDLVEAGANVILEADPRLVPVCERSFEGIECVAKQNPPGAETKRDGIDFQVPCGNLGRWLRPDLDSFPGRDTYLAADAERAAALREQYRAGTEDRLIGIAWISKNKRLGPQKSMTLMELAPLTNNPGLRFIDLQYGDTADERAGFENETGVSIIHDDGIDQMADLDAFAAQVAAMDLIISVSNTTVHFAGA